MPSTTRPASPCAPSSSSRRRRAVWLCVPFFPFCGLSLVFAFCVAVTKFIVPSSFVSLMSALHAPLSVHLLLSFCPHTVLHAHRLPCFLPSHAPVWAHCFHVPFCALAPLHSPLCKFTCLLLLSLPPFLKRFCQFSASSLSCALALFLAPFCVLAVCLSFFLSSFLACGSFLRFFVCCRCVLSLVPP